MLKGLGFLRVRVRVGGEIGISLGAESDIPLPMIAELRTSFSNYR